MPQSITIVSKSPERVGRQKSSTPKSELKALDAQMNQIKKDFAKIATKDQIRLLGDLGVGDRFLTCQYCGKVKTDDNFHNSSELNNQSKKARICMECADAIVRPVVNGVKQPPTKESVIEVLQYLNKPFKDSVFQSSVQQSYRVPGSNKKGPDLWGCYIKLISNNVYQFLTFYDSDMFLPSAPQSEGREISAPKDELIIAEFEQNRKDVIRLIGWDPFSEEKPSDQPTMYAQLIGYLDASNDENMDMMRISSIIEIIKGFIQRNKINDKISDLCADGEQMAKNGGTIKQLSAIKKDIGLDITSLAKESRISLASNKAIKKDAATWTGKVKLLKEKNLRAAEENQYDYKTCIGMKQVAEYSAEGLLNRIKLDESASAEIIANQRRLVAKFKAATEDSLERTRILLRENTDLKKRLVELGEDISVNSEVLPYDYQIPEEEEFEKTVDELLGYDTEDVIINDDDEDVYELKEEDLPDSLGGD